MGVMPQSLSLRLRQPRHELTLVGDELLVQFNNKLLWYNYRLWYIRIFYHPNIVSYVCTDLHATNVSLMLDK